jgi:hypothetical protein
LIPHKNRHVLQKQIRVPSIQPNRRLDIPIGEPDLLVGKALFGDGGYRS